MRKWQVFLCFKRVSGLVSETKQDDFTYEKAIFKPLTIIIVNFT